MNALTKQEQLVLYPVLGVLLIGWAVKSYRLGHSSTQIVLPVEQDCPARKTGRFLI